MPLPARTLLLFAFVVEAPSSRGRFLAAEAASLCSALAGSSLCMMLYLVFRNQTYTKKAAGSHDSPFPWDSEFAGVSCGLTNTTTSMSLSTFNPELAPLTMPKLFALRTTTALKPHEFDERSRKHVRAQAKNSGVPHTVSHERLYVSCRYHSLRASDGSASLESSACACPEEETSSATGSQSPEFD